MNWLSIALIFALASTGLRAQQKNDAQLVQAAAGNFVLVDFSGGIVAFDVTPLPGPAPTVARTAQEIDALAALIRAKKVGTTRDFYFCTSRHPSSCKVSGADVVISFSRPEIAQNEAFVDVRLLSPTGSARVPVVRRQKRLLLVRQADGWAVKRVIARSVT